MSAARLMNVPLSAIRLTPANPRTNGGMDIEGLRASIAHGLAQRPTLIEIEPGVYEVLTGERRVRAGMAAQWDTIPALVEDPLSPIAAHTRRVSENLHRQELGPLDEARALKLDWLNANAVALELGEMVDAALAESYSVRDALTVVSALLAEAQWSSSRPTVTQETYLESRGLAISKAALRKKLQLLNISPAAEERLEHAGLTEAGIRAFLRLSHDDQTTLLSAIDDDPKLAKETRTIVQWVLDPNKQRTMRQAIAIARGEVPRMERDAALGTPEARFDEGANDQDWQENEGETPPDRQPAAALPQGAAAIDEQTAAELVLPLMETAQLLQSQLDALNATDLAALPEPWGGFARDALASLLSALHAHV